MVSRNSVAPIGARGPKNPQNKVGPSGDGSVARRMPSRNSLDVGRFISGAGAGVSCSDSGVWGSVSSGCAAKSYKGARTWSWEWVSHVDAGVSWVSGEGREGMSDQGRGEGGPKTLLRVSSRVATWSVERGEDGWKGVNAIRQPREVRQDVRGGLSRCELGVSSEEKSPGLSDVSAGESPSMEQLTKRRVSRSLGHCERSGGEGIRRHRVVVLVSVDGGAQNLMDGIDGRASFAVMVVPIGPELLGQGGFERSHNDEVSIRIERIEREGETYI